MGAARWSIRLTLAAGTLVAVGALAAAAESRSTGLDAELDLVPAGPGTIVVKPAEDAASATCVFDVDAQTGPEAACFQHYAKNTRVKVTAVPDGSAKFVGWGDFKCELRPTCTIVMGTRTRYLTASFSPVKLSIQGEGGGYGQITVTPGGVCDDGANCTFRYRWGTTVTLSRAHAGAADEFWQGSCLGSVEGQLDADTCRITLQGDELLGAGYAEGSGVPPPLGTGINVKLGGSGKGRVTGSVVGGTKTLVCGKRCTIANLVSSDYMKLKAKAAAGSHFYRWSDPNGKGGFNRQKTRTVPMKSVNRLRAWFVKN
jgi:hypothetical protein